MGAVESSQIQPAEVAALLREYADDPRTVFDSLERAHGDLGLALGSLRYRLALRLNAAGLDRSWNLDALAPHHCSARGRCCRYCASCRKR